MFRLIEGLPPDVLAVEAVGDVTHEDYRGILIPKAEAMMAKGSIKVIYVVGAEFKTFDLEALWDDGTFGIRHWNAFSHVAVVTDLPWLRSMAGLFAPFMPARVRIFKLAALSDAKKWISDAT